jgi:hypothetical protein
MSLNQDLDRVLSKGDPLTQDQRLRNDLRKNAIWQTVLAKRYHGSPRRAYRWRTLAFSGLTVAAAAVAISASLLTSTATPSAAVELLNKAAHLDAASASLPNLFSNEYYYQSTAVTQECVFSGPSTSTEPDPKMIRYITTGTRQTWVNANGQGKVVMSPNPTGIGGSNFASPEDEARWVAEGKPFNACDTANAGAPTQPGSISGYSGFGYIFNTSSSQVTSDGANVANLPSSPSTLRQMLTSGEISSDGSTSAFPQECPIELTVPFSNPNSPPVTLPPTGLAGCSPSQEVTLLLQLLQLPEASAKFGSVAYQVLASIPGAELDGTVETQTGEQGSQVSIPEQGYIVDVVLNPTTGALLQSSITSSPASLGPLNVPVDDSASYGSISVVNGLGVTPS